MLLSSYTLVVVLYIVLSMVGVIYYLRIIQVCYFQKCHFYMVRKRAFSNSRKIKNKDFCLGLVLYFICFLVINPNCLVVVMDKFLISFFFLMWRTRIKALVLWFNRTILKAYPFYEIFIFSPIDSPSKTMKDVFYFI